MVKSATQLLKKLGLRVTAIKVDPYVNIDAGELMYVEQALHVCLIAAFTGTMSPTEHGQRLNEHLLTRD